MIDKLLNQYTYTLSANGKPYTPKESFEEEYTALCKEKGIEKYYEVLVQEETHTKEEAAEELEAIRGDTDQETAYNIIEQSLLILTGVTVELIREE